MTLMTFYDLVSSWERTNRKHPVRIEGLLTDGRSFTFEHDGEQVTLALDGQRTARVDHHAVNGYIDEDQFKDLLVQLLEQDAAGT
jgi:hypothetical protein